MRWLITTGMQDDLSELGRRISDLGGQVTADPVPMSPDEQIVFAEGPDDLPERLRDTANVRAVHPDSDVELGAF